MGYGIPSNNDLYSVFFVSHWDWDWARWSVKIPCWTGRQKKGRDQWPKNNQRQRSGLEGIHPGRTQSTHCHLSQRQRGRLGQDKGESLGVHAVFDASVYTAGSHGRSCPDTILWVWCGFLWRTSRLDQNQTRHHRTNSYYGSASSMHQGTLASTFGPRSFLWGLPERNPHWGDPPRTKCPPGMFTLNGSIIVVDCNTLPGLLTSFELWPPLKARVGTLF